MNLVARRSLATAAGGVVMVPRHHPRHVVLFALVAGLLAGAQAPGLTLPAAVCAAAIAWRFPLAVAATAAVLAGGLVGEARMAALAPGRLAAAVGHEISAEAVLLEPARIRANGSAAVRARILRGAPSPSGAPAGDLARRGRGEVVVVRSLDGSSPPGADVGSVVRLHGRLAELGRADAFQRRRGAHVAVIVSHWSAGHGRRGGVPGALDAARRRASDALGTGLAPTQAALLRGMVIGQDEAIDDDTRTAFERSGLAHLLAVSGQNVVLLCTLVLALGAAVGARLRTRLIVAAALVVLYVPLAGAGPSIQRAGVMGVAGLVAALAGRPASRWYALGLAAAVTLAANPAAAEDPGWQLSFAAVAGLLALTRRCCDALVRAGCPRPVAEVAAVTAAATLATAPLLAFHFEEVSTVSLGANLIAAPAVPPLMWLGMLSLVAAQVAPGAAELLNTLNAPLLAYIDWVAAAAAGLPLAAVPVALGGPWGLAAAYGASAVVAAGVAWGWRTVAPREGPAGTVRAARVAAVAAVLAVALVVGAGRLAVPRPSPPAAGELVVSFLDVGQGDATLLQLDGAAVLVDTGPPGGPVLARLAEAGVERLDLLVLTHAQADHEGMALPVLRRHRPRLVLNGGAGWRSGVQAALRPALAAAGARVLPAREGQTIALGALRMRVLWPDDPTFEGDPNRQAVVLQASVGDFDVLLPADAESDVTRALPLDRVEALKVAHHGSADEGLPRLLETLRPQVAAIEVGERNTYGHPAASTLAALRSVPHVVRTDEHGTVRLRVRGGAMTVEGA